MNGPLVSVIVPVYNVQEYIERCLLSILKQTYKNFEVIVINDGSTDCSLDIVERIAREDERIFIYNKKNGGQATARNMGLRYMKGDYLIMVDSDDYIQEHLIETCLKTVRETKCDLVLFDRYNINEKERKNIFLQVMVQQCQMQVALLGTNFTKQIYGMVVFSLRVFGMKIWGLFQ
ncbi:glycosyltransferase family 2 protein [Priestia megaterium]